MAMSGASSGIMIMFILLPHKGQPCKWCLILCKKDETIIRVFAQQFISMAMRYSLG